MTFTFNGVAQIAVYFLLLLLITKPMGLYLNAVFAGRRTWLSPASHSTCTANPPGGPPGPRGPRGLNSEGVANRHVGLRTNAAAR